jgi:hypothetical protein
MRVVALCLVTIVVLISCGCGAVHPPAQTVDPVSVYVANYGFHSAVMLPLDRTHYIEYAFGDWAYCAEDRDGPLDAIGALLMSGGSAFGRRYIEMKPGQAYPTPRTPLPKVIFPVAVSRPQVEAIERTLDRRWTRHECTVVHNPGNDTDYVRDSEHYSLFHSCNQLTADTLRNLGCRVDGPVMLSSFRLSKSLNDATAPGNPPPR